MAYLWGALDHGLIACNTDVIIINVMPFKHDINKIHYCGNLHIATVDVKYVSCNRKYNAAISSYCSLPAPADEAGCRSS